jgi:hypothetical protein
MSIAESKEVLCAFKKSLGIDPAAHSMVSLVVGWNADRFIGHTIGAWQRTIKRRVQLSKE